MRFRVHTTALYGDGDIAAGSTITFFAEETGTALASLYSDATTSDTRSNPFTVPEDGIVDFYTTSSELWVLAEDDDVRRPLEIHTNIDADLIDVKDCGAIGDGITDDTVAIHTARDSTNCLIFPSGTYLVTGLTANVSSQEWILEAGTTIKLKNASNAALITVTGTDFKLNGGVLDGNKAGQTSGSATQGVIVATSAARMTLRDVEVKNGYENGVYISGAGSDNLVITGCRIHDHNASAIHLQDVDGLAFCGNHLYAWALAYGGTSSCSGMSIWGGTGENTRWAVADNVFTGNATSYFGIESASGVYEAVISDSSFTGNVFDAAGGKGNGISGHFYHCSFIGNTFANGVNDGSYNGLELVGNDLTVTGNSIEGGSIAISCGNSVSSYNVLISGNSVATSATNGSCIWFGSDASYAAKNITITGNLLTFLGNGAGGYGIAVGFYGSLGKVEGVVVSDNLIVGQGTSGNAKAIFLYGGATSKDILIRGNLVRSFRYGIVTYPHPYDGDEVTITGNDLRGALTPLDLGTPSGTFRVYQNVLADNQVALVVTGSRGSNAALASLLTQLATLGLITDSSS